MDNATLDLRRVFQGVVGFVLYCVSWLLLLALPVIALIVLIVLAHDQHFVPLLIIVLVILVLGFPIGLLLRWLAKGVLQGNKTKMAISVVVMAATGMGFLFLMMLPSAAVYDKLQLGGDGVGLLIGAIGLLWTLLPRRRESET